MSTQITGGSERGRKVRSARGGSLRPTAQRVRASIFSILGTGAVEGARVLDLYAGTGVLGIEALSRGASFADFVEVHHGRCQSIRETLRELGLAAKSRVRRARVENALGTLDGTYSLVLVDPPYDTETWDTVMGLLDEGRLVEEDGHVVAEHRHKSHLADSYGRLARVQSRRYGDTSVSIYRAGAFDG